MKDNKPTKDAMAIMKHYARYIAMVVRNAMEDFHCKHLSDKKMEELNPIIRNAIYTAIYTQENHQRSSLSKSFMDFHLMSISKYWEEPELLEDFKKSAERLSGQHIQDD